jgi:hypothetical protein
VQGIETNVQRNQGSHLQSSSEKSSEKLNLYRLFCENCDCSVSRSNNFPLAQNSIAVLWLNNAEKKIVVGGLTKTLFNVAQPGG